MAEIENVLDEMNRISDRMLAMTQSSDGELTSHIIELRQEFSTETGNLIGLLPGDARLTSQPALFDEFQERLSDVRRRLTSHQAKWSPRDISENRDEYLLATQAVHGSIADYVLWAKNVLQTR